MLDYKARIVDRSLCVETGEESLILSSYPGISGATRTPHVDSIKTARERASVTKDSEATASAPVNVRRN